MRIQPLRVVKGPRCTASEIRYTSPDQVYEGLVEMKTLDREHFKVLHLDGKNRIINNELISIGHLNQVAIHPREVFKGAVLNGSAAIICVHNHPTGDPTPSREDSSITGRLRAAGELLGIQVLDHIIFGDKGYYSFASRGWPSCEAYMGSSISRVDVRAEGMQEQDETEEQISLSISKARYLFASLIAAASAKQNFTGPEIEGLAWLINDIERVLEAASECSLYRKVEKDSPHLAS